MRVRAAVLLTALLALGALASRTQADTGEPTSPIEIQRLPATPQAGSHSLVLLTPDKTLLHAIPSQRAGEVTATLTGAALTPAAARGGQLGPLNVVSPFKVALRLGALVSPHLGFAGGADVALPQLHLLPSLTTRVDADYILVSNPSSFFDFSSFIPITIDQIYSKGLVAGSRVYFGGGIGPYIGKVTHFGGKVFVGAGLSSTLGVEATLHFAGVGDPLVTVQVRFGL